MKKLLLVAAFSALFQVAHSQYALPKGKAQLNVGVGMSGWGIPVYIGADLGIHKDMSIGAEVSFRRWRENWRSDYYSHTVTGIGINWNYHFNSLLSIPTEWDVYAGLNAGYYIWNSPVGYPGDNVNGTGLGGQLGFRYYFNKKIGINLEGGSGTAFSGGKLGLTIKL